MASLLTLRHFFFNLLSKAETRGFDCLLGIGEILTLPFGFGHLPGSVCRRECFVLMLRIRTLVLIVGSVPRVPTMTGVDLPTARESRARNTFQLFCEGGRHLLLPHDCYLQGSVMAGSWSWELNVGTQELEYRHTARLNTHSVH